MQTIEKNNENVLHKPQFQKALREYHETRKSVRERFNKSGQRLHKIDEATRRKRESLQQQRRDIAQKSFNGCEHAVVMQDLKAENEDLRILLEHVDSTEMVRIQGKRTPLVDFAQKQAFGLSVCSTKAIYRYFPKREKFNFKHSLRCGRRACSVCGHFEAIEQEKLLMTELTQKISEIPIAERSRKRLFHIVLTVGNVELEDVFEIQKAWRHIQKMKIKNYKTKENPYSIWKILEWGIARWEVTRNEETGLYHPHLHILALVDGWLAPQDGGYWSELERTWEMACENTKLMSDPAKRLRAEWEGQHYGLVMYFKQNETDPRAVSPLFTSSAEVETALEGSIKEMAKYPVKSTDFTKIATVKKGQAITDVANEVAKLLALMHGRRLMNGFGGFRLRQPDEEFAEHEEQEEGADEEESYEVIFAWSRREKRYLLYAFRPWVEQRFRNYLEDMADWKTRKDVYMFYGTDI